MKSWMKVLAGVLAGAAIGFPLGMSTGTSSEPEIETREVLPKACDELIDAFGDELDIHARYMKLSSEYPNIVDDLFSVVLTNDGQLLSDVSERVESVGERLDELNTLTENSDLVSKIEACNKYRN